MTVTNIKKNKSGTVTVTLDNGESYLIAENVCTDFSIFKDCEISVEQLETLLAESDAERAYDKALTLLETRIHSVGEITSKLYQRGFKKPAVESAIDRLSNLNLLNDVEFARVYCNELINQKKLGRFRVLDMLKARGISRDIAEEVFEEFEYTPFENINELIQKKFGTVTTQKEFEKAYAFLFRSGYSREEIKSAFEQMDISY